MESNDYSPPPRDAALTPLVCRTMTTFIYRLVLMSLAASIVNVRPLRYGGGILSLDAVFVDANMTLEVAKEERQCWVFSHMPKSGGFTIQQMLMRYAKRHKVSLGRYDTEKWVEGETSAQRFLDEEHPLMGGGYVDGLRFQGAQHCKWFTMFRQ